jgi:hypothetical protein
MKQPQALPAPALQRPGPQARPWKQPRRRAPQRALLPPSSRYSWELWHNGRPLVLLLRRRGCLRRFAPQPAFAEGPRQQSCDPCALPRGGSLPLSMPAFRQSSVRIVSMLFSLPSRPRGIARLPIAALVMHESRCSGASRTLLAVGGRRIAPNNRRCPVGTNSATGGKFSDLRLLPELVCARPMPCGSFCYPEPCCRSSNPGCALVT